MPLRRTLLLFAPVLLALALSAGQMTSGLAQGSGPTPPPTFSATLIPGGLPASTLTPVLTGVPASPTPTATEPPPTPTATATPPQPGFYRPLVVVSGYAHRPRSIVPGGKLDLEFQLANQGQIAATNVLITFSAGDLMPHKTGGAVAAGRLEPGESRAFSQAFIASSSLTGLGAVPIQATLSYTDENGNPFTESLSLAINSSLPATSVPPSGPARPTPTPTSLVQAQLVIQDTRTDVAVLQPGTRFVLEVMLANVGNADARRVTMIAGGGTLPPEDPDKPGGGDVPGGVSGSGGEFTNFSPLGASNIQSLGDVPAGTTMTARQPMIVNVTTNPGAYSFKISFMYSDEKGGRHVDDQVITLLVYLQPVVEISFYRDPGPIFASQPNALPIQIVNLGRKSVVLGNMRVSAQSGELSNNTLLVGALDAGGYFTLDASLIPHNPGSHEIIVTVDYNDDFNQPQSITRTIPVEVLEMPVVEEPPPDTVGEPGQPPSPGEETFWQKTLRFLRGLVGLDSAIQPPATSGELPGEPPPGETGFPSPAIEEPLG